MAAISVLTSGLCCHGQVDLLQGGGLVAFVDESAPTGHGGNHSCISGCRVRWQTGGGDLFVELDWLGKAEDSVVVVNCWPVPVRMVDNLRYVSRFGHAVSGVVLPEENLDVGGLLFINAVSGREDVGGRDKGSSAPWVVPPACAHQRYLWGSSSVCSFHLNI